MCLELISFSRSLKDKLTISSQIVVEILYNIPDKKIVVFNLFGYVTRFLKHFCKCEKIATKNEV